jgi:hypothetical protein
MTGNLEDQLLRDVLAHEATRHDSPGYDPAELAAGARAGRRRRRALVGGAALALTVILGSVVFVSQGVAPRDVGRETVPQGSAYPVPRGTNVSAPLVRVPGGRNASALSIPFCEEQVGGDVRRDVLHVHGTAYDTDCAYARPHHRYLWYHAGRTVMSSLDGLEVLVGDRFVKVSQLGSSDVRISMDGKYLAWFEEDALFVHDLVAQEPTGRFTMPDEVLSAGITEVEGMDWGGRTYVQADGALWVHDLGRDRWAQVRGLPQDWGAGDWKQLAYLTPEGFAVESEALAVDEPGARSVEGRVTPDGAFEPVRAVPLGRAVWSPDRSHAVQLSGEGFTAHPAEDLGTRVPLDVPVDPADVPAVAWDAQWESGSTVLLTEAVTTGRAGAVSPDAFVTYRCSAVTGDCRALPSEVNPPLSALAHPGG